MNSNQDGASLYRCLVRLSPDVFSHPVWVKFVKPNDLFQLKSIQELQHEAEGLQAQGDAAGACQVSLICAVLQHRSNDNAAALASAQMAWALAESHGLPQLTWWAAWGAGSLCLRQGHYRQAAEYLNRLQVGLSEHNEWVLSNVVATVRQTLLDQTRASPSPSAGTSDSFPSESMLKIVFDWLLRWGESPLAIQALHREAASNGLHNGRSPSSVFLSLFSPQSWRSLWHTLRRVAGRELRPKWIESNEHPAPSLSPAIQHNGNPPSPFLGSLSLDPSSPEPSSPPTLLSGKANEEPSLTIYCLGAFRVYQDDKLITNWSSGKGKAIFKYMVVNRDRPIPKDILMDLFWRDTDFLASRNSLNVAIYSLRQDLRAVRPDFSHILFQDDSYLLNPDMAVWVDVEEFVQRCESGQSFERRGKSVEAIREYEVAESLYQGDIFEEDLYEDWLIPRREGLKDSYLIVLDRLSRYYLEKRRYTTCIHLCQKILAKDDCREDAHRQLMRCYSRQGQPNLALRQYHLCVEALARELEVSPMQETVALYHQIRNRQAV